MIMRLEWIDRLKGLAILLVVAGHFIQQHVWGVNLKITF